MASTVFPPAHVPAPWQGVLRVWRRNFESWKKFYKASLVGALGEPVLYLLAIGYGLGRFVDTVAGVPYAVFLAPGIVASAAMNSASFETTFGAFARMREQHTYAAILATPIGLSEIVAADILWGGSKGALAASVVLAVAAAAGLVGSPWAVLVPPLSLLVGVMFGALGMIMTARAQSWDHFSYYFTLVISVMFLFSGVFFPLESLPAAGRAIAWLLPLTHAVTATRALVAGQLGLALLADLAWMVAVTAVAYLLAVRFMRRRLIV